MSQKIPRKQIEEVVKGFYENKQKESTLTSIYEDGREKSDSKITEDKIDHES